MVKATFNIPEKENRILNIIKGQQGFTTKEQAFLFIIQEHEQNLEPKLRPEFIKEMKKIEKGKHFEFKNIDDLRKQIGK